MQFTQGSDEQIILIYITCENRAEAEKIGEHLLKLRLTGCVNIFDNVSPMFFWPPKEGIIDRSSEVVLLVKTTWKNYAAIEAEVTKIHSYDVPCIFAIPVMAMADTYHGWLTSEMDPSLPVKEQ